MWIFGGNANKLGDVGGSPGESSFLFLNDTTHLGINLLGEGVGLSAELGTYAWSGALSTTLENPRERIIFTPGRTHNRIRSSR